MFMQVLVVKTTAACIEVSKRYQYINKQNDVEMMKIGIEINIGEYATPYAKEKVTSLINEFTDIKTKSTNVKMNIIKYIFKSKTSAN